MVQGELVHLVQNTGSTINTHDGNEKTSLNLSRKITGPPLPEIAVAGLWSLAGRNGTAKGMAPLMAPPMVPVMAAPMGPQWVLGWLQR